MSVDRPQFNQGEDVDSQRALSYADRFRSSEILRAGVNPHDAVYHSLLINIMDHGVTEVNERTGVGTRKVFGRMLKFPLDQGFPALTTKRVSMKRVLGELEWFVTGKTNIRPLVQDNNHIWDDWPYQKMLERMEIADFVPTNSELWHEGKREFADSVRDFEEFAQKYGNLGPVYGSQWRKWRGRIDQLAMSASKIKEQPADRRNIVMSWDPEIVDQMALPPCHLLYQFGVAEGRLNTMMYMRSVDTFLGLPFNIASYAALNHAMASITGLKPGELTITTADTHIYLNHMDQVREQLSRESIKPPTMQIVGDLKTVDDIRRDVFRLEGYNPKPAIKAPIAV